MARHLLGEEFEFRSGSMISAKASASTGRAFERAGRRALQLPQRPRWERWAAGMRLEVAHSGQAVRMEKDTIGGFRIAGGRSVPIRPWVRRTTMDATNVSLGELAL
ncbi:MAG: hypothetical protein NTV52_21125 [Acidobacteria bacterium]|nr:hypothetical protein [Acidobacteriota bacterium]